MSGMTEFVIAVPFKIRGISPKILLQSLRMPPGQWTGLFVSVFHPFYCKTFTNKDVYFGSDEQKNITKTALKAKILSYFCCKI